MTPPSAVPAPNYCALPTMYGCAPALPAMTTPLPTLLPKSYYFNNNKVNYQLQSGLQICTNVIPNQPYVNVVNQQVQQFSLVSDYNQIQPATNFYAPVNGYYFN
nr:unnamed protein product [Callosobruchus analis]